MDFKKKWLSEVKHILKTSPLAATVGFGLIQLILEKLIELEFACPCNLEYNWVYTSPFFIVPSVIVFLLMCVAKLPCDLQCKSFFEALSSVVVSATIWSVIVFIDGRYWACLKTNWSGKYEMIENAAPQKWCKPANSSEELLNKTQLWYSQSQSIGLWTALGLVGFYAICYVLALKCAEEENETSRNEEYEEANAAL